MRQRKKLCRHEESNLRPSDSALRSLNHRELDGERGPLGYILFARILLSLTNVSLSFLAVRNHSLFTAWDERKKNFFFGGGGVTWFSEGTGGGTKYKGGLRKLTSSLPPSPSSGNKYWAVTRVIFFYQIEFNTGEDGDFVYWVLQTDRYRFVTRFCELGNRFSPLEARWVVLQLSFGSLWRKGHHSVVYTKTIDGDSEDALLLATQTPKILCHSSRVGFAPENIVIVAALNELKLSFCLTVLEYTKTTIHQSGGG